MEDAHTLQLRLEKTQGALGAARFRKSLERNPTGTASTILARAVEEVAQALCGGHHDA
jgi:hypothetical protein